MNDYSMDNGMLLSNVFTHVERRTSLDGIVSYSCSCKIFRTASSHRAAESASRYTCSHCMYMLDYVEPNFRFISEYVENNEISLDDSFVQKLLKNVVEYIGPEVVHLTSSSDIVKHAFSIVCSATNDYSIAVLSGDFIMCM